MCSHTLPLTREKQREGAPFSIFPLSGGRVQLHVGSDKPVILGVFFKNHFPMKGI